MAPREVGGLGASVAYVDTEGAFSAQRLAHILQARFPALPPGGVLAAIARVHVFVEPTCARVLARLEALEPLLVAHAAPLLLVDSVASVVRKEFEAGSALPRQELLARQAGVLKHLGAALGVTTLVCNQARGGSA